MRIDGSGMLDAEPDAQPITEVGQTFDMHMDRTPLGDIAGRMESVAELERLVTGG